MKKKLFITGISSEMMLRLVSKIDPSQYDIIGLSRSPEKIQPHNFQLIKGDILNIKHLGINFSEIDMIIHAAAITHTFDAKPYFEVNLKATQDLVDVAKANDVKKFVFISSRTAGMQSGAYGISKIQAENYIKANIENWLIFRPAEVYGASKQEGIEDLIRNTIQKPYALCPIQITSPMFPIFVDDLIQVLYDKTFNSNLNKETITIGGKKGYSFKEVIQLTARLANKKVLILPLPKLAMMTIKQVVKVLPFSIGIMPDQIDRLYSEKDDAELEGDFRDFEDYVKMVVQAD